VGITIAGITGISGAAANELSYPYDLTLDSLDTVYIAERGNNRVQKWLVGASSGSTVAGQASGLSGSGLNYFNRAGGVVVDSNDNLYVTDPFNHRVQYWPNGSTSGTIIAGTGTSATS
jgi:NHL repeat